MRKKKDKGWRFVIPVLIALGGVALFPFAFSVYISLINSTAYSTYTAKFIGINNYISLFRDANFWNSFRVTLIYVAGAVSLEMLFGTLLALLIDSLPKGNRVFMIVLAFPIMIAPLVYGITFKLMYNSIYGFIPQFLRIFNINVSLLSTPNSALVSMMVVDVFQWTSFVFLIIYSALQSVPKEPLEAAKIDGAGYWKSVWYVLLPILRPIFVITLIFRVMDAFKIFDQVFVITDGGPGTATTTSKKGIRIHSVGNSRPSSCEDLR